MLLAWRAEHGDWCPGDGQHDGHFTIDLTVHHVDRLAMTGNVDTGNYEVMCRSANSRLG